MTEAASNDADLLLDDSPGPIAHAHGESNRVWKQSFKIVFSVGAYVDRLKSFISGINKHKGEKGHEIGKFH